MGLPSAVRVYGLLILSACNVTARADAALDAELEAEWGGKRVKTVTVESPKDRYSARLKLLEAKRDSALVRCKTKGSARYCEHYSEEQFRRDLRALAQQFEGQLDEIPKRQATPKGFGDG